MESIKWTYDSDSAPKYSYIFEFENAFNHPDIKKWLNKNWTLSFYYVGVYLAVVFGGRYYMQSRESYSFLIWDLQPNGSITVAFTKSIPKSYTFSFTEKTQWFELRRSLIVWNTGLAIFSIMGACRTLPEFIHVLRKHGLYHSICVPSFIEADKVSGFWTWMFVLSKVPELGDTVFIVLRKKPLIFLHWYHHITVLLYSWFSFTEFTASARWFVVMNYCVHSVMYSYYALVSMGKYPPKFLSMSITFLQLTQMIVGCCINVWAHSYMAANAPCGISHFNIKLSMAMYFSYFVLFARFFYKAYLAPKPKGKKEKAEPIATDAPSAKKNYNEYPRQRNGVVAH